MEWMTTDQVARVLFIAPDTLRTYAKRDVCLARRIRRDRFGPLLAWYRPDVLREVSYRAKLRAARM